MATVLDSFTASVKFAWRVRNDLGLSDPTDEGSCLASVRLTEGEAINQSEMVYHDQTTIGASATRILDLAGGLTNGFGAAITFKTIKGLLLKNKSVIVGDILRLESDGTAGAKGLFKAVGDAVQIPPGGFFAWGGPSAAGAVVTTTTFDLLNLVNEAATIINYEIVIVGTV